jgi:hypothetical protein
MKRHKRDPVPYVFAGLLLVSVLIGLAVLGVRSHLKREYLPLRHPIFRDHKYGGQPAIVEQDAFARLLMKVIRIDLGTGIYFSMRPVQVESIIGLPEGYEKKPDGHEIYCYTYPADTMTTKLDQHQTMGMLKLAQCAQLVYVFKDNRLREMFFDGSHFGGSAFKWEFIRLADKALADCTREDLVKIFGEPTDSAGDYLVWYFRPKMPIPQSPVSALYIHAELTRPNKRLEEFYISLD